MTAEHAKSDHLHLCPGAVLEFEESCGSVRTYVHLKLEQRSNSKTALTSFKQHALPKSDGDRKIQLT